MKIQAPFLKYALTGTCLTALAASILTVGDSGTLTQPESRYIVQSADASLSESLVRASGGEVAQRFEFIGAVEALLTEAEVRTLRKLSPASQITKDQTIGIAARRVRDATTTTTSTDTTSSTYSQHVNRLRDDSL